jgi:nucleoside-diphosphate-sugar epimerase
MENKKILITGATGYLGSHLLRMLIDKNYSIVLLIRSTSNLHKINDLLTKVSAVYIIEEDGINRAFSEHEIECVFHCATSYGRDQNDSLQIIQANLILPLTILNTGKKYGLKYFFNTDTLLDKRISEYSLSKRQFNDWLKVLSNNVVAVNIALEHFYGPGDDKSKFVSWVVDSVLKNVPTLNLTKGEQKRDFIYITDVISAFLAIFNWAKLQSVGYFPFEVGSGVNTSIKDLVNEIANISNFNKEKLNFGAISYRDNEVMESNVNLERLNNLGWKPKVILEEGLKTYIVEEKRLRGII